MMKDIAGTSAGVAGRTLIPSPSCIVSPGFATASDLAILTLLTDRRLYGYSSLSTKEVRTNEALLYVGSGVIFVWGVANIMPTRSVVKGFGETSEENRRIITMEWIAEGLALCSIGMLVLLMTAVEGAQNALLYTSDAADDLLCVDLGGRRIIKKK